MSNIKTDGILYFSENVKFAGKVVVDALKPLELTVAEVREVLAYINDTIEHNVVLK